MARRDEESFVGREAELRFLEGVLGAESATRIVFLHGPGGIGKSSLLRRLATSAEKEGWTSRLLDGRDLDPMPGEIERLLAGLGTVASPLVLVDTYERIEALDGYLRQELLPSLPDSARIVIAGRRPPRSEWLEGGWERVVAELAVDPLPRDAALELLDRRGITDPAQLSELLTWSGGSPLTLTLGADAASRSSSWHPGEPGRDGLAEALIRRVMGSELESRYRPAVEVAALTRAVDPDLLEAVVPGAPAEEACAWLAERSFARPAGAGARLHDVVRSAVRTHLQATEPDREREMRRRLADHLFNRASHGEARLMVELAELIEDPALRWGLGAEGAVEFRVDGVRVEDIVSVRPWNEVRGASEWWAATEGLLLEAPELAVVVRDRLDVVRALTISTTPRSAPPAADRDPVLGPWLAHARENVPDGNVIVWRDALDFTSPTGDAAGRALATANSATILRSGLGNPRWSYLPIDPENEMAVAFATGVGARRVDGLDIRIGTKLHECHVLYHGRDGVLGGIRDGVYRELGLDPPSEPGPMQTAGSTTGRVRPEEVREALRRLHKPVELAASPLATGDDTGARAESVRVILADALERAFGQTPDEELLRTIARRAWFEPEGTHEAAAWDLHVSRATYFRRLRQSTERILAYVAGPPAE